MLLKTRGARGYYKDWDILNITKNPGHLHRTDSQGNRIKLNFATLIAKEVSKKLALSKELPLSATVVDKGIKAWFFPLCVISRKSIN